MPKTAFQFFAWRTSPRWRTVITAAMSVFIAGCSIFGNDDEDELVPAELLKFEQTLDDWFDAMEADVQLDKDLWGNPYGAPETFIQSLTRLKDEYFAVRRTHLYNTHSIDNTPGGTTTTILGSAAVATALVPTDDSLGLNWTGLGFDDTTRIG